MQDELRQGFLNLSQNNFYKPNYMNRLSQDDAQLAIQQIFYNESRNVISPQLLYEAIMPRHRSQQLPSNNNMSENPYPDLMGGNSSPNIRKIG